jgi:hypothetical protein
MRHRFAFALVVAASCGGHAPAAAPAAADLPSGEQIDRCVARWHDTAADACSRGTWPSGVHEDIAGAGGQLACRVEFMLGNRAHQLAGSARRCLGEQRRFDACAGSAQKTSESRCRSEGLLPDGTKLDPADAAAVERCLGAWRDGVAGGPPGWRKQCAAAASHM